MGVNLFGFDLWWGFDEKIGGCDGARVARVVEAVLLVMVVQ
jgi:hypothetical protein